MTSENLLFPGRPDYKGPETGVFGLLHHAVLFEPSHDVLERVAYVRDKKPTHEISIRLWNMIYLGGCPETSDYEAKRDALLADFRAKRGALHADYEAKRDALQADFCAKRDPLWPDYEAKRDALLADFRAKRGALHADYEAKITALNEPILAYIVKHIPDCAWNGKELNFGGKP